jgi:hypothetical protein
MRVKIDKPGSSDQPGCIDRRCRPIAADAANLRDTPILDADVGAIARHPCAIDHHCVPDDSVELGHGGNLPGEPLMGKRAPALPHPHTTAGYAVTNSKRRLPFPAEFVQDASSRCISGATAPSPAETTSTRNDASPEEYQLAVANGVLGRATAQATKAIDAAVISHIGQSLGESGSAFSWALSFVANEIQTSTGVKARKLQKGSQARASVRESADLIVDMGAD